MALIFTKNGEELPLSAELVEQNVIVEQSGRKNSAVTRSAYVQWLPLEMNDEKQGRKKKRTQQRNSAWSYETDSEI